MGEGRRLGQLRGRGPRPQGQAPSEWSAKALRDEAQAVGVNLDDEALSQCGALYDEVVGGSVNVTSIRDAVAFRRKMIVDSLCCLQVMPLESGQVVTDVGSGGGFPGLPIAIALPGIRVVLVEATRRKCAFLSRVVRQLGLPNASVACVRAEDLARTSARESSDAVVARALAPLSEVLELTAGLCAVGGTVVAMKGPRAHEEMAAAARAPGRLGLRATVRGSVVLPGGEERLLLAFAKEGPTPTRYPRRPAARARSPL